MAAGLATLKLVSVPGFFEKLSATTTQLVEGLNRIARNENKEFSAQSVGGMFGLYFRPAPPQSFAEVMQTDRDEFNRFFHHMLESGVAIAPSAFEAGFVSAAHGQNELDQTFAAARQAFKRA